MRLLTGAAAVSSALLIKRVTDSRLKEAWAANTPELGTSDAPKEYQPWMALPPQLLLDVSSTSIVRPEFRSRFLDLNHLDSFSNFYSNLPTGCIGAELASLQVARATQAQLQLFNEAIHLAEIELVRIQPHYSTLIENLIQAYVPMIDLFGSSHDFGLSTVWLKGVVFFNIHQTALLNRRVENLAHEIAHQILIHYQMNDFLIHQEHLKAPTFSGIRNTERPAILSLHAAAALSSILQTARIQNENQRAAQAHSWLQRTVQGLKALPLTALGSTLLEEVEDVLE